MVKYEILADANRNYIVYMHTNLLNHKKYIGVTGRGLQRRSGPNGIFYKGNAHFYSAIKEVGWDNFSHEVLLAGLTRQQAGLWEYFLIKMYNTTNPDVGYNNRSGGFIYSGYSFSLKESREKSSLSPFDGMQDDEYFLQTEYSNIKTSNKGRVLVLYKGEWMLSNFPQAMPYYTVYVGDVDNRRRNIPVHQLVYFTFHNIKITPIPSGYCIMHKDGNTHNNCIQNLVYTTTSQCSLNRIYNLNKSSAKPVNQYDLNGNYLFTYPSAQIAAKSINITESAIRTKADSINKCANGLTYKAYGYQWRFVDNVPEGIDIDPAVIAINGKRKKISQYTRDNVLVKIWDCGRDAMRAFNKVSPSAIYKCANNISHSAWGYVWKWT